MKSETFEASLTLERLIDCNNKSERDHLMAAFLMINGFIQCRTQRWLAQANDSVRLLRLFAEQGRQLDEENVEKVASGPA